VNLVDRSGRVRIAARSPSALALVIGDTEPLRSAELVALSGVG
jgi:hypothetical protein